MTTNQTETVIARHIEATPGVRSGKPRVKGTRITVSDVVLWTEQGMCPDELVTQFPALSLADVHAALAYYHDNQSAIDRQIRESREFADSLKTQVAEEGTLPEPDNGNPVSSG